MQHILALEKSQHSAEFFLKKPEETDLLEVVSVDVRTMLK